LWHDKNRRDKARETKLKDDVFRAETEVRPLYNIVSETLKEKGFDIYFEGDI